MTRRLERVNTLIRNVVGEVLLSKISDPRIDPALVSVTRVETSDDLTVARVFISVMGPKTKQELALRALRHASGHIQEHMKKQVQLRNTPVLDFVIDEKFKKTLQTLTIIRQAMDELEQKQERAKAAGQAQPDQEPSREDSDEESID